MTILVKNLLNFNRLIIIFIRFCKTRNLIGYHLVIKIKFKIYIDNYRFNYISGFYDHLIIFINIQYIFDYIGYNKYLVLLTYKHFFLNNLDITMELRVLGAPWTLHSWTLSLSSAHEARSEGACTQLLRDFIQLLPDDKQQMQQLAQDSLPLLFAVFRAGKVK